MRALLGVGTASGFLQAASKTDPTKKQPSYYKEAWAKPLNPHQYLIPVVYFDQRLGAANPRAGQKLNFIVFNDKKLKKEK